MTIYVITGSTGEYSDRTEWIIRAVRTEDAAKTAVLSLTELANDFRQRKQADEDDYYDDPEGWENKHGAEIRAADPGFRMYYTGTFYTYDATELED